MGDRYFYAADTGKGKVLAIFADGENGIWTVMEEGYSHIEMLDMDGTKKAEILNEQTWENVARRGMVSNAYFIDGEWKPEESDNDGLWTSMYAGGELMRYATLKNDPNATPEQIEDARKTATLSTEAVLFLTYLSMRQGTVESYNRAQRSGTVVDLETGKYYTSGTNWRIYQSENATITVSSAEGYIISSIKFTYVTANSGYLFFNGSQVKTGTVVTVNAESATFNAGNTGTATNGQVRFTAIEVVYAKSAAADCEHKNTITTVSKEATCTIDGEEVRSCECGEGRAALLCEEILKGELEGGEE